MTFCILFCAQLIVRLLNNRYDTLEKDQNTTNPLRKLALINFELRITNFEIIFFNWSIGGKEIEFSWFKFCEYLRWSEFMEESRREIVEINRGAEICRKQLVDDRDRAEMLRDIQLLTGRRDVTISAIRWTPRKSKSNEPQRCFSTSSSHLRCEINHGS